MTHPPLADIAKRAFLAAMKTRAPAEAMWIAAADAVVEECAKVADGFARPAPFDTVLGQAVDGIARATGEAIAEAIRALKGNANG